MKTKTRAAKTKEKAELTLKDRLSRLTYHRACQLLGPERAAVDPPRGAYDEIDIDRDVYLRGDLFRLRLRGAAGARKRRRGDDHRNGRGQEPVAIELHRLRDDVRARRRGRFVGAGREDGAGAGRPARRAAAAGNPERTGVARPGPPRAPGTGADREVPPAVVRPASSPGPTTRSPARFRARPIAWRCGARSAGESYCSCPDFRTNTLGTCKHILHVLASRAAAISGRGAEKALSQPRGIRPRALRRGIDAPPATARSPDPELVKAVGRWPTGRSTTCGGWSIAWRGWSGWAASVTVYPDAEELIQRRLFERHMSERMAEIRKDPARHPLRKELLKVELLPYQLEGIAFAAGVGRAILADDMGLGKTIQGVGVAEILAREAGISRVLVVCPASLKSQWRSEIHRFSDRTVQLVVGGAAERARQYDNDCFFTVCNYEQVLRDILAIERVRWDLIILDEGQRIKNWESKTARVIKGLQVAVRPGAQRHAAGEPAGRTVLGGPVRRRPPPAAGLPLLPSPSRGGRERQGAGLQEPGPVAGEPAADPPPPHPRVGAPAASAADQRDRPHSAHRRAERTARRPHAHRVDDHPQAVYLRNGPAAAAKGPVDVPHVGRQHVPGGQAGAGLFEQAGIPGRVVRRAVRRAGPQGPALLRMDHHARPDRADARASGSWTTCGWTARCRRRSASSWSIASRDDPRCRLFITTNAGSTGLNLQAANTVINVDLPWNPAVLEQRIGRAHRMGQQQPVQVYVLVTEGTIEESLLAHAFRQARPGPGGLGRRLRRDPSGFQSGMEELRRRLEVLLGGASPRRRWTSPSSEEVDASRANSCDGRRDRVAAAGGEMLGAVFNFLGELVSQDPGQPPAEPLVAQVRSRLAECVEEGPSGRQRLTVTLPDRRAGHAGPNLGPADAGRWCESRLDARSSALDAVGPGIACCPRGASRRCGRNDPKRQGELAQSCPRNT